MTLIAPSARMTGRGVPRFWTPARIADLERLAPDHTATQIAAALGASSTQAIYHAARAVGVVVRNGRRDSDCWRDPAWRAAAAAKSGRFDWTEARVAELRRLALDHSASEAARLMGLPSRNAAIGKAARLGFAFHGGKGRETTPQGVAKTLTRRVSRAAAAPKPERREPAPAVAEAARAARLLRGRPPQPACGPAAFALRMVSEGQRERFALPADPVETLAAFAALPATQPRTLADLEPGDCRWPIAGDEARYCGAKRAAWDKTLATRLRGAPCYCLTHVLAATRGVFA